MANYCDHVDIEQAESLTAAAAKQYSPDQTTAIERLIDDVHGELIDIIGSEPVDTNKGLRSIEVQAVQRLLWNKRNEDKDPKESFSEAMLERLRIILSQDRPAAATYYAKETH